MLGCTGILNAITTDLSFRHGNLQLASNILDYGTRFEVCVECRIYECHIGMSGEDPCVSSYCSFEYSVLPRVIADGYNCVMDGCLLGARFNSWPLWSMPITPLLDISAICSMPFRPGSEHRPILW